MGTGSSADGPVTSAGGPGAGGLRSGSVADWSDGIGDLSDLEQLRLLVLEQLVDLGDVLVGGLVQVLLGTADVVLPRLAVLGQPVEAVLGMPPDVADGDPGVLRLVP